MSKVKTSDILAKRIKKARKDRGLSQQDLAELLNITNKAISSYEVGRASPSIETLREISRITYRPISYFINEGDPDDITLQIKLKTIERELLEIKRILKKKQVYKRVGSIQNAKTEPESSEETAGLADGSELENEDVTGDDTDE